MSSDGVPAEPPVDPRFDRFAALSVWLQRGLVLAAVLAMATAVTPDALSRWLGGAMVAVLVGVPLLRVGWFVSRWFRRGDPRFASIGAGVLAVVGVGLVLALLGV